ncbi:hypothetical protein [Yersinia enterocolitica]|uniref:hypothetical protein n=1 Tax=Yersinia enterocolitica TaxID=630 RepID=UPI003CFC3115
MLSKDKLKYPTEITDEQLRYLITAFENKMTEFYPVGREAEIARQLLSLREQLAELKAFISNECFIIDPEDDENCIRAEYHTKYGELFTAAKPSVENDIAKFMAGVKDSMAKEVAKVIQKEALLIMFDEITPDTETIAMQYESLVKRINCPED